MPRACMRCWKATRVESAVEGDRCDREFQLAIGHDDAHTAAVPGALDAGKSVKPML